MPQDHPPADNPPVLSAAGRLHLSLADWARFHRVFLTDGGDLLRPDTIKRLITPATGPGLDQAMGWSPAAGIDGASIGQQGSNTNWAATALVDEHRTRTALVVCNDGRTLMLWRTPRLASNMLAGSL